MFIIEPNPNRETKILLRGMKQKLGQIPPHFELFATVHPQRFKMFLDEIMYLSTHKNINPDFFAFLRYYIASHNGFAYCVKFNAGLLLAKGYTEEQLSVLVETKALPLDAKHQALFTEATDAIDKPSEFKAVTIENLKLIEWTDADIFDAIDHGAFLFRFSKVLKAYNKE